MALKSAQNNQFSEVMSQLVSAVVKTADSVSRKETAAVFMAAVSLLLTILGAVMMSTSVMVAGASLLAVSLLPMLYRWCREDYNRDF